MTEAVRRASRSGGVAVVADDQNLERSFRIVRAANTLLEEEGLEGLTIRAVLKKTGLARRALYERFDGKDDLVLAVFEQTIRSAARHYGEQVAAMADPLERLKLIITGIVLGRDSQVNAENARSDRRAAALSREHLRLAESRPGELQEALDPLIALIARQLSDGMEAGMVRRVAPQRLATLVYNLVATTVQAELLTQQAQEAEGKSRDELAADIWEFCRRAIAA